MSASRPYTCLACQIRRPSRRGPIERATAAGRSYIRPSTAPKPAIDIKHIRQNPGLYEQNCVDRNYKAQSRNPWRITELQKEWQDHQARGRRLRERNNELAKKLKSEALDGESDRGLFLEEAKELKGGIRGIEEQESRIQDEILDLALDLPNLSSRHTPNGDDFEVLRYINEHTKPVARAGQISHVDIGLELDLLDFSSAAQTSGWGWYYLKHEAALLEQALVQYAIHVALRRGWKLVSPPSIVYSHIAAACGFQPRDQHGEQQVYALEQAEKDKGRPALVLAGTAEIPLASMKANQMLNERDLPLKTIGVSRCYRAEAGARGVDTKGLYRVHEFTKVEMFAWTMPDARADDGVRPDQSQSDIIFTEMVELQEEILGSLGLHCRVLEMPSADLGASAARKIDVETWFPSRRETKDGGWGEVTSASVCTDYQTRRLATRVKDVAGRYGAAGKHVFPWTLNGTAMAVPRVLAATLENGWDERRRVVAVPECLRQWMPGGIAEIEKR